MVSSILIIDDNPDDRELAIRQLKRELPDIDLIEIANEIQFEKFLFKGNFDLIITDYQLCWSDGLAVLKAIKQKYPECPVIMFTDSGNEEIAVEGMKLGLSDYVLKRHHFRRLSIAVKNCLEQQEIRNEYIATQERFRLAQEAANLGIWDWNLADNCIIWNENHERLFGLSPGSFDGSYGMFTRCIYVEDRELVNNAVNYALENQTDYSQEFRVVHNDGNIRWIADRGRFFYDASGQAIRATGIVLDITHSKEREIALEKYTQGLMQAYRLQDEFLAVASHELRTPLNAILGWLHILGKYPSDENANNQRWETIERNLKRQQLLFEQILDTSRLKDGTMHLESRIVDLKRVVEGVIANSRLPASAKSIVLESMCNDAVVQVLGDERRLHQVIWNLVSNAIKFTSNGGCVRVSLSVLTKSDAVITVSDTGQGINPDFLPYVFDQFRQEDSSRTRQYQGAGLGLTIARYLVELHGGNIRAESLGIGKGAIFTVKLPLASE